MFLLLNKIWFIEIGSHVGSRYNYNASQMFKIAKDKHLVLNLGGGKRVSHVQDEFIQLWTYIAQLMEQVFMK